MYAAVCLALLLADASPPPTSATVRAVWLADLDPDRVSVEFPCCHPQVE